MLSMDGAQQRLDGIPGLTVSRHEPLAQHTRFALGGPAGLFADAATEDAFVAAAGELRAAGVPWTVIGGGTNLVVHDAGYHGAVLRLSANAVRVEGKMLRAAAGAPLQALVDASVDAGLAGIHKMTGVPGSAGGAIYGNAGAYGQSISDTLASVRFFDGETVREVDNAGCEFRYRESIFKRRKDWLILSAAFELQPGDANALREEADGILATRNKKYPPDMRCAGSIFKNLILAELPSSVRSVVPETVVKKGKVPAAWFLDQVGARGLRLGGIQVAHYHANLIYNDGGATASELRQVVDRLKALVAERYSLVLGEEVQFLGFDRPPGVDTLEKTPLLLEGLIAGLSTEELQWKPDEQRWSIGEVLAHLAHTEQHCFLKRMRLWMEQADPEFPGYSPQPFEAAGPFSGHAARESLRLFGDLRCESLQLVRALPAPALSRQARHLSLGTITLGEMLNEWAFHDLGHLRQIAELVRAVRYFPRLGPFQKDARVAP